jgi:hypothetical protein
MSDDTVAKRALVIKRMIASIVRGEDRAYYVGLVGYWIDGFPASASGLTVDPDATPDIAQTEDGFSCSTCFPPDMVHKSTVEKKGIITRKDGMQLVEVTLEAKLNDIYAVAEFAGGVQHDLFNDFQVFESRQMQFMGEMHRWFADYNARPRK